MSQVGVARLIATVAHKGQKRADGKTDYITHPLRVVELVNEWSKSIEYNKDMIAAAWLHDVVEDTKVTLLDLEIWGIEKPILLLVGLLTKFKGGPADKHYYDNIKNNLAALMIKCADRCSNLEDAIKEVKSSSNIPRWERYLDKTRADLLPLFVPSKPHCNYIHLLTHQLAEAIKESKGN